MGEGDRHGGIVGGRPQRPGPRCRPRGPLVLAGALAVVALLAAPGAVPAFVYEVTLCTDTTPVSVPGELRHAITTSGGGATLILLPACRITLTGAGGEDANAGGDLDIFDAPVLHLQGAGVDRTILDADRLDRVLDIFNAFVTISDLTLTNGAAGAGGALKVYDSGAHLIRVAVTGSRAPVPGYGGGIDIEFSNVRITGTTVAGNQASRGGGLTVIDSELTLEDSTVSGNQVAGATNSRGGAILATASLVDLRQVTLSGNRAEGTVARGGALFASETAGAVDALQVTVTGNEVVGADGGGVSTSGASVSFRGSIVAANLPDNCGGIPAAVSADYNLQDGASCAFTRLNDQSQPDPGLGPLAANGGLTPTHLPLPDSPALDRGPALGCLGQDQRGVSRPRDGTGSGVASCDVGAVERGSPTAGRVSLPRAIDPR